MTVRFITRLPLLDAALQPFEAWYCAYVPGAGVEPARYYYHWCLRPTRLPIPPPRQGLFRQQVRSRVDSNHRKRFCRPLPSRSATRPWYTSVEGFTACLTKASTTLSLFSVRCFLVYSLLQGGQGLDVSQSRLFCAHEAPCITSTLACFRLGFA